MVRLIISFLCVLGTLFIYVMVSSPELVNSMGAAIFFSLIPLIFIAGANLVRVSAFSSPKARGYEFVKYIGALLVIIIIGISYSEILGMFNDGEGWTSIFAGWLILLQIGLLVTPFLKTRNDENAKV